MWTLLLCVAWVVAMVVALALCRAAGRDDDD